MEERQVRYCNNTVSAGPPRRGRKEALEDREMEKRIEFLRELTTVPGLPGYEREVKALLRRHLEPVSDVSQDNLGSVIGKKKGRSERPRVMLAAHMDEIGFMVTGIDKDGFLRFQTLGGWWEQVMLAQRVSVITSKCSIPGIIGSKPPHILPAEDRKKMFEKKDMFIDIGASGHDEAVAWGVRPGDPIVPDTRFVQMKNSDLLMAKAWDDRVGCALVVDVLCVLAGLDHPNTVYGVGTVQEEVGLRGAVTSANAIEPDVAFALEAGIAGDTPGVKEYEAQGRIGKGPVLLVYDSSMIPNTRLRDLAVEVAESAGIPYQFDSMAAGGTDAGRIQMQGRGVPALVIGVPTRYVHSHTGIISLKDYALTLDLLVRLVMALDEKRVASLVD